MPVDAPPHDSASRESVGRDKVLMDLRARHVYANLAAVRDLDDVARTQCVGETGDGRFVFIDFDADNRILAIGVA